MYPLHEGGAIPVVDPTSADGAFGLLWLIIALPALGALVLLVGGPLTKGAIDKWGHVLGALLPDRLVRRQPAAVLPAAGPRRG